MHGPNIRKEPPFPSPIPLEKLIPPYTEIRNTKREEGGKGEASFSLFNGTPSQEELCTIFSYFQMVYGSIEALWH
jgi:hypothetical protein